MIEFLPWYAPGSPMLRCGGDGGCGSIIMEGDAELHRKWHQTCIGHPDALPKPHVLGVPSGPVCTSPTCEIPRKPGYPPHGPHEFRAGG